MRGIWEASTAIPGQARRATHRQPDGTRLRNPSRPAQRRRTPAAGTRNSPIRQGCNKRLSTDQARPSPAQPGRQVRTRRAPPRRAHRRAAPSREHPTRGQCQTRAQRRRRRRWRWPPPQGPARDGGRRGPTPGRPRARSQGSPVRVQPNTSMGARQSRARDMPDQAARQGRTAGGAAFGRLLRRKSVRSPLLNSTIYI